MPNLLEDFRGQEIVGSGAFTLIFSAIDNIDDRAYSVKRITVLTPKRYNLAKREAEIMAKLDHSSIVKYQRTWSEEPPNEICKKEYKRIWSVWKEKARAKNLPDTGTGIQSARGYKFMDIVDPAAISYRYIQMELCQDYNLDMWLKRWIEFDNSQWVKPTDDRSLHRMKSWFRTIVEAVNYIHSQGIVHSDLRPENIYFSKYNDDILKLGGFSRATSLNDKKKPNFEVLVADGDLYKGPELINDDKISQKSDVYALGLIFCELVSVFGSELSKVKAFEVLRDQKVPSELQSKTDEANFILSMVKVDPEERPSCKEILNMSYMKF